MPRWSEEGVRPQGKGGTREEDIIAPPLTPLSHGRRRGKPRAPVARPSA
jgi:hypothetical protein